MVGEGRDPSSDAGRSSPWVSAPLAPWTRALLVVAAVVSCVLDLVGLRRDGGGPTDALVVVAVYAALALVAVRVTLGAGALLVAMAASVMTEMWLPAGLIGLGVSGVVVGKTAAPLAVAYIGSVLVWLVVVLAVHDEARDIVFVPGAVLVVSVSVGAAYAALSRRSAAAESRISDLERERARSIAEERNRIARELHDIVAHHVTMASMHANVVAMSADAEQRERSLHVVADSTRQALTELRWMLRLLQTSDERPGTSEEVLRLEAVTAAVREHLQVLGLSVEMRYEPEALAGLPLDLDVALGRILQEAATNVVKHADPARPVSLEITREPGRVLMEVCNGVGDRPPAGHSGMGLGNMRARAAEHGGTVVGAQEGATWVLRCEVPLR